MKIIRTVNGWVIYQITTAKKSEKYDCEIGGYIRFSKAELDCYGFSISEPDMVYGQISIDEVIADCKSSENGNNF